MAKETPAQRRARLRRQQAAQQLAQDMLSPERSSLERERERTGREAERRARGIQGTSEALARILSQIGPGIEQSYQQAAGAQSTFAKGFSDGLRELGIASAGEANQLLAQQGSPQQVDAASGQADVLYGLGGYGPASTLGREGAAFGAAARMLPGQALRQGQQDITGLAYADREAQREFADRMADLEAKYPALYRQALRDMEEAERADRAIDIQADYLGIAGGRAAHEQAFDWATLGTRQAEAAAGSAEDKAAARAKAEGNRDAAVEQARKDAFALEPQIVGVPATNPKVSFDRQGKYLAQPGKSEFRDGTTNQLRNARREGRKGWEAAREYLWTRVNAPRLMARYGYSRGQVEALITQWLTSMGLDPPSRLRNYPR